MRGKTMLWLALTAVILGALVPMMATAQSGAIFVDPSEIYNNDLTADQFTIDINVEDMVDLYGLGFEVKFAPFTQTLVVSSVVEGDFMAQGGHDTDFFYGTNAFDGIVQIYIGRIGQVSGASGDGTLASITFKVLDAGDSPLNIQRLEAYDSTPSQIYPEVRNGMYYGPTCDVTNAYIAGTAGDSPIAREGDIVTVHSEITNDSPLPLNVMVRYDLFGKDGRLYSFWAGQTFRSSVPQPPYPGYIELTADGFDPWWAMWDTVGTSPWIHDETSYVTCDTDGSLMGLFTFGDITLPEGWVINDVWLEALCDGPYNEGIDYDAYVLHGGFHWLGSLYSAGVGLPEWTGTRWVGGDSAADMYPPLLDEEVLNDFLFVLYFYDPGGEATGADRVHKVRLRVEIGWPEPTHEPVPPPVFTVPAGESMWVDPVTWITGYNPDLWGEDHTFYRGRATVFYSYNDYSFSHEGYTEYPIWCFLQKPKDK
jgi:hypothetical protein